MNTSMRLRLLTLTVCLLGSPQNATAWQAQRSTHGDLVALFVEWRGFQHPKLIDGVPDYSASAMAAQQRELATFQRRLAALDTTGWTIPQQVDVHVVRAEMSGLEFDHRVLRPWARNPAFYVTVFPSQSDQPAREGHQAYGSIELWSYDYPLSTTSAADLTRKFESVPKLLEQARGNLVGKARDLWTMGIRSMQEQSRDLDAFARRVGDLPRLLGAVRRAQQATEAFATWLESELPSKTEPSGVGIENYNWHLEHVQLVPYTWEEQVLLMQRELDRSLAALALEEQRNRGLAPLEPISTGAEWQRRFQAAVTEYMAFFRDREILSIREYMEPALRDRVGQFSPGPREFFNEVSYRDPIVMRTHDFHWIDLARMEHDPHPDPIRRGPLLYNIFITRTEGFATAMEEMMMDVGFLDNHPRGRELIYILIAQRAARALGDLMMHANRYTLDEAARFAVSHTPRNWLTEDGSTVWGEQHLYLQQPSYGTSYLIGKMQIEKLLADRRRQLGDAFTLKRFMDEFTAVGLIPMSLVRWELLGER